MTGYRIDPASATWLAVAAWAMAELAAHRERLENLTTPTSDVADLRARIDTLKALLDLPTQDRATEIPPAPDYV